MQHIFHAISNLFDGTNVFKDSHNHQPKEKYCLIIISISKHDEPAQDKTKPSIKSPYRVGKYQGDLSETEIQKLEHYNSLWEIKI